MQKYLFLIKKGAQSAPFYLSKNISISAAFSRGVLCQNADVERCETTAQTATSGQSSRRSLANTSPVKSTRFTRSPCGRQSYGSFTCSACAHTRIQLQQNAATQAADIGRIVANCDMFSCSTSGGRASKSRSAVVAEEHSVYKLGICARAACLCVPCSNKTLIVIQAGNSVGSQARTGWLCKAEAFSDTRAHRVILISRQRNGCQNADDRHDDHQFDQGKTLLDGTLHELLLIGVDCMLCRARAVPAVLEGPKVLAM